MESWENENVFAQYKLTQLIKARKSWTNEDDKNIHIFKISASFGNQTKRQGPLLLPHSSSSSLERLVRLKGPQAHIDPQRCSASTPPSRIIFILTFGCLLRSWMHRRSR